MEGVATIVAKSPTTGSIYITVKDDWFEKYAGSYLGTINYCHVSQIREVYCDILIVGSNEKTETIPDVE